SGGFHGKWTAITSSRTSDRAYGARILQNDDCQGSRLSDQLPPNRSVLHVPEAPSFAAAPSIPTKVLLHGPDSDAVQIPEYFCPPFTRALHVPFHPPPVLRAHQVP